MASTVFLLFCALIPQMLAQCTLEEAEPRFKRSVYEFSVDLLTRLAQEKESHFVASTMTAWTLLASTSLGAANTTLAELKQVLQLPEDQCFNYKYLELASSIYDNLEFDVVPERAWGIFYDDKNHILESFKAKLKIASGDRFKYMFPIKSIEDLFIFLSFDVPEQAAQRINHFVKLLTHTDDEIVTPSDLDEDALLIIDAIFVKGTWNVSFPYENTRIEAFYNERGAQIGQTNSMFLRSSFCLIYVDEINSGILELPYGFEERYSMLIFLPYKEASVYSVIEKLKLVSLKTIQQKLSEFGQKTIAVNLPRFKITSELNNLKELWEDMGLKTMFRSDAAQFPNLSDHPFYVSNFIQKADIEVTEKGIEDAAVTEEEFFFRTENGSFNVNKPFLFMVVDKRAEVPLFVGAYSKPSEF